MKILIVISYFVPEIGSAAHVYFDLAKGFVKRGHEVTVITSYPREYNLSKEDQGKQFLYQESLDGIKILRAENQVDRDNLIKRGLEHYTLSNRFLKVFKKTKMDFDVCLIYIPPLPLYNFAKKIKKIAGIPSVLNFQDYHPQELTDVGVLTNPIIIKIMKRSEKKAMKTASHISVLTEGGIQYVIDRGGKMENITHINNSVPNQIMFSAKREGDFKRKESIEDRFLVTYAGILSPYQGLDLILDAAKKLKNNSIVIYIIGDGTSKGHLEQRVKDESIQNVKVLPFQNRDEYFNILESSDVSIISLDPRMKAPCFPGKTMNIMSVGKPILAIVPESETHRIIQEAKCGIIVDSGRGEDIVEAIMLLFNDRELRTTYGDRGRKYAEEQFNLDKNILLYEEIFNGLKKDSGL